MPGSELIEKTMRDLRYWTAIAFRETQYPKLRDEYLAKAANLAMISLALREEQRDRESATPQAAAAEGEGQP